MVIVINSLIGRFDWKDMKGLWLAASTARLQVSDYSQLSDYNSSEWLVKKKSSYCTNYRTEHSQGFSVCIIIKNPLNSPRITFNFQNRLYVYFQN